MLEVLPDVDGRGSLKFDLQEVAYCDDQVRVIDSFGATCVLEGVRVTVGWLAVWQAGVVKFQTDPLYVP